MDFDFGHSFGLPFVKSPFARLIPTFAGSQYGTIDTDITFAGDSEVEFEFVSTDVSASRSIAGGSSGRPVVRLQAGTGTLKYFFEDSVPATVSLEIPAINWADGKIHTGKVSRVGDLFTLECEGNTVSATHVGAVSQTWNRCGTYGAALDPFVGEILSVKFTNQSGAQDEITNYVFDSGSDTDQPSRGGGNNVTLINFATTDWNRYTLQRNISHDAGVISEAWVGDNLVVNGTFDADTDWTKGANWSIGSGVASAIGATSFIYQSAIPLNTKDSYLFKHSCLSYTSGTVEAVLNGATTNVSSPLRSATGEYVDLLVGNADGNGNISISGVALTGSVDNVSVQHLLEVA